jgi:DNA-binding transcriptional regulator LsrR (DeoR family)
MDDSIIFAICSRFLTHGKASATAVAGWAQKELGRDDITRERVYPLIQEGMRRGFLVLRPPRNELLAQRIADRYKARLGNVRVLDVQGPGTLEHVASAGAELTLSLIKELGSGKDSVHVGLGSGNTLMKVARQLGRLLKSEDDLPDLVFHALTSGFSVREPMSAPVAMFSNFNEVATNVGYVGLFAEAVVRTGHYEEVLKLPGVSESFEEKDKIDIIITSHASANDESGQLYRFMKQFAPAGFDALQSAGWIGDVLFRPYSESKPILVDSGIRAVTLFEISELIEICRKKHKYVVLISGPSSRSVSIRTRSDALRPLLSQDLRVWTHLVTDTGTAREVLQD